MDGTENRLAGGGKFTQERNDDKRTLAVEAGRRLVEEEKGPVRYSVNSDRHHFSDLRFADKFHPDIESLPLLHAQTLSGTSDQSILNILQLQQVDDDVDITELLLE